MDLVQLRHFLKIVECRSFTRAAAMSKLSQPALSQQMARLEKEFGQPLFVRRGRQIELTPFGQKLSNRAERIIALVDDIESQVRSDQKNAQLKLGTVPSIGPYLVTKMLQWLQQQHPQTRVTLHEHVLDHVMCCVDLGRIDLAVVPQPAEQLQDVQQELLLEEEMKLVLPANHRLAKKPLISLSDLEGESLILLNEPSSQMQQLTNLLVEKQINAPVVTTVDQFLTLQHLVVLRQGISLLPQMAIPQQPKPNLCYRKIHGTQLTRSIMLCWNRELFRHETWQRVVEAFRHYAQFKLDAGTEPVDAAEVPTGNTGSVAKRKT
ncbi:MAG TPA: LysR family transcriptional regulator [Pirellulaceae bacterium]|nr:LysR family transcriptional regulator [Pirellulaceae bacterium]